MLARTLIAFGALAIALLGVAQWGLRDRLLVNDTPSVPRGLYVRTADPIAVGAFVTVRASDVAPSYARVRGFAESGDRFIKRVAATSGVRVCAKGAEVSVGSDLVQRQTHDSVGRELPSWSGCHVLGADEVFLLGETPDSFDSRYFGIVRLDAIEGVWRPL